MTQRYGCHVDLGPDEMPDGCVLDYGQPSDCHYAEILVAKGKGREDCASWKPITFVPREAGPGLLEALQICLGVMKLQRDVIEQGKHAEAWSPAIEVAEKAIAKATGEQA